jgi:hypothetical protein
MKTTITLPDDGGTQFAEVARIIADGDAPDWLINGLKQFGGLIEGKRQMPKELRDVFKQMHDAADQLIKLLGVFRDTLEPREDIEIALDVLPRIKDALANEAEIRAVAGGPKPDYNRRFCAAVVVEAWKLVHGKVEPRSIPLFEACNEYWQACGGEYRGEDVENWRRDVDHAVRNPQQSIRLLLMLCQGGSAGREAVRLIQEGAGT